MMDRALYIRFVESVMSPGRSGNSISKAMVATDPDKIPQCPRDELMEEIIVGDRVVCLKSSRGVRFTPLTNVRDYEPMPKEKVK